MRILALGTFTAICLASTACGGKHAGVYEKLQASGDATAADGQMEAAEALWAQRVDPDKLKEALDAYEAIMNVDPNNRSANQRLVRGWYLYGDAHATEKEVKVERWGVAIEWGARCLALNDDFAGRIKAGERERDAVVAATKDDVPCLYWTSSALGKWGKIQSLSKTLAHLPTVKAYISKIDELEPSYFHYGPARYWGTYYAALPSFAGQDKAKSAEYYAASIQGQSGYLGSRVLRAEYLHVLTQDAAAFKDDLNFVLGADPNAIEGIEAENALEQRKAKGLMDQMNDLFDKKALEAINGQ